LICISLTYAENRLLEFNETTRYWVSIEDAERMALEAECGKGDPFMDITEFQDLGRGRDGMISFAFPAKPSHEGIVNEYLPRLKKGNIEEHVRHLSSYATRYYTSSTGISAAKWIYDEYVRLSRGRLDIKVRSFDNSFPQTSVIARIEGSGPNADEVVIIGSHLDSTSKDSTAPGADDDASGTSTVMEIFSVLAEYGYRPQRTIEFHAYAAEEVGLRGSQAIASAYVAQGVNVVSMMQLDMTGYVKNGNKNIGVVTDYTNKDLTAFVRQLIDTYTNTGWTNTVCGYACSDHGSWNKAGFPAAFPFEQIFADSNPQIHTKGDVIGLVDFDHCLDFAKLGLGYLVELSSI